MSNSTLMKWIFSLCTISLEKFKCSWSLGTISSAKLSLLMRIKFKIRKTRMLPVKTDHCNVKSVNVHAPILKTRSDKLSKCNNSITKYPCWNMNSKNYHLKFKTFTIKWWCKKLWLKRRSHPWLFVNFRIWKNIYKMSYSRRTLSLKRLIWWNMFNSRIILHKLRNLRILLTISSQTWPLAWEKNSLRPCKRQFTKPKTWMKRSKANL